MVAQRTQTPAPTTIFFSGEKLQRSLAVWMPKMGLEEKDQAEFLADLLNLVRAACIPHAHVCDPADYRHHHHHHQVFSFWDANPIEQRNKRPRNRKR